MTRALYPGTFDPMHNGHIDIAVRASAVFEELVVAVYDAPPKKLLFSTDERVELASAALEGLDNVTIAAYNGLTVECARQVGAHVIVRGLRNIADFEFEYQIGWANGRLAPDVELCCLFCNGEYGYLSSTILKEVASLGGDVRTWAPEHILAALQAKFPESTTPGRSVISRSGGKLAHRE